MKISFDLDGVVAATDSALLGVLHNQMREGVSGGVERLRNYYASRQVMVDPLNLLADGDEGLIITGRVPSSWKLTKRWVNRRFPTLGLILVSTDDVEDLFAQGEYDKASECLSEKKLEAIREHGVQVHFDNNPIIIQRLRAGGVLAVLFGGAGWMDIEV